MTCVRYVIFSILLVIFSVLSIVVFCNGTSNFITNILPKLIAACIITFFAWVLSSFITTSFPIITPAIKTSMSVDGGKTYSGMHLLPVNKNIFLKCEISARTGFLWRLFLNTTKSFHIKIPYGFEWCKYSGKDYETYSSSGRSYPIGVLTNRKKIIVTMLLKANNNKGNCYRELKVTFEPKSLEVYNKTIVLHFDSNNKSTDTDIPSQNCVFRALQDNSIKKDHCLHLRKLNKG